MNGKNGRDLSFNPCFSGFRIATVPNPSGVCHHGLVSILVLVDFALRLVHTILITSFYVNNVSILVLVDFALRPMGLVPRSCIPVNGFNPCFSGFRIATGLVRGLMKAGEGFQSLF